MSSYRVAGELRVCGKPAGQTVTDKDLADHGVTTPDQVALLVASGALIPVTGSPAAPTSKE